MVCSFVFTRTVVWYPLRGFGPFAGGGLGSSTLSKFEMANRRDWGGGGDDPEESTQRMIERIWESLMDIRARMDQ
ncbi:hypothetical protein Taro_030982 [Colocasia esculenta]|uniref:Uncharacterized protein n=1 Tax=Colocasia esculenta TaxID=4460 RepID=A0A843VZI2_COLES|nr:hypothetical protein [Colocasia esculenta]